MDDLDFVDRCEEEELARWVLETKKRKERVGTLVGPVTITRESIGQFCELPVVG
jgi:hypothetical protein